MIAKALLLDPTDSDEPGSTHLPRFLSLGIERAGWVVSRATRFEAGMDGTKWLSDLHQKIEEADVLVSLGNFLALYQTGTDLPSYLDLISQKLDSGCIGIFDGCSSLTSDAFPDLDSQIRGLFDRKGIRLTPTKVGSKVQDYERHSSPYCCAFRKVDDCLLDPSLFPGIDAVWAYGNRLIAYSPEIFPLIEATGLHVYIDRGDRETCGAFGQRNAVAVRSRNFMVFSGAFLSDRRQTMGIPLPTNSTFGGILPGIEDNAQFAERLIDSISRPPDQSSLGMAFELFCELERTLGQFIEDVLASTHEPFIQLLPKKTVTKLRTDAAQIDLSKADFLDLVLILRDLWAHFQPLFSVSSKATIEAGEITTPLFEINDLRKYLVHPQKARKHGQTISRREVDQLRRALALIQPAAASKKQTHRRTD